MPFLQVKTRWLNKYRARFQGGLINIQVWVQNVSDAIGLF